MVLSMGVGDPENDRSREEKELGLGFLKIVRDSEREPVCAGKRTAFKGVAAIGVGLSPGHFLKGVWRIPAQAFENDLDSFGGLSNAGVQDMGADHGVLLSVRELKLKGFAVLDLDLLLQASKNLVPGLDRIAPYWKIRDLEGS